MVRVLISHVLTLKHSPAFELTAGIWLWEFRPLFVTCFKDSVLSEQSCHHDEPQLLCRSIHGRASHPIGTKVFPFFVKSGFCLGFAGHFIFWYKPSNGSEELERNFELKFLEVLADVLPREAPLLFWHCWHGKLLRCGWNDFPLVTYKLGFGRRALSCLKLSWRRFLLLALQAWWRWLAPLSLCKCLGIFLLNDLLALIWSFFTTVLSQSLPDVLNLCSYVQSGDRPNENHLELLHLWGSTQGLGVWRGTTLGVGGITWSSRRSALGDLEPIRAFKGKMKPSDGNSNLFVLWIVSAPQLTW